MSLYREKSPALHWRVPLLLTLSWVSGLGTWGRAQIDGMNMVAPPTGTTFVSKQSDHVQMMVNSTHMLTTQEDIERASVHNDAIITVRPMSRNELMVSAKATGVTQVDLYGPDRQVKSVQIVVMGDARELEAILKSEFPMANFMLRPIQNAIVISGQVTSDLHVEQAVAIAEQFYPTVINRIEVIGVHTIMLHAQVMEVSRTKLRQLGPDFAVDLGNDSFSTSIAGTLGIPDPDTGIRPVTGDQFRFAVVDGGNAFLGSIKALQQRDLIKVMADPTLVAIDGRPASFNSGGEFPIPVPSGLGQIGIDFREYGTRLDFVAKVRGDGRVWLEVRPVISEIDPTRSVTIAGTTVPGLRSRYVDTAVELRAGQTLAIAGLLQTRTEAQSAGIPGLCDLPFLGAIFRSNREVQNEVELLILVTPDFAGAMDPHEVPPGGPGYNTFSPSDKELYWRGYIETPAACPPGGGLCLPDGTEQPVNEGSPLGVNSQPAGVPSSLAPTTVNPAAYRISHAHGSPVAPSNLAAPR